MISYFHWQHPRILQILESLLMNRVWMTILTYVNKSYSTNILNSNNNHKHYSNKSTTSDLTLMTSLTGNVVIQMTPYWLPRYTWLNALIYSQPHMGVAWVIFKIQITKNLILVTKLQSYFFYSTENRAKLVLGLRKSTNVVLSLLRVLIHEPALAASCWIDFRACYKLWLTRPSLSRIRN